MTEQEMMKWIDGATYEQLLSKWRFAPLGSPWFQGRVGKHYGTIMAKRREEVGKARHTEASKSIGWR